MNFEFTSGQVESVITQFYNNQTNAELNEFLTNAQNSSFAWYFCWDLLELNKSLVVQYYGANTLYQNISKNWDKAPDNCIKELHERLFNLMEIYSKDIFKPVFVKICVSFGCFILQTISREWPSAIDELISSIYQACGDYRERNMLQNNMLEILRIIPEELSTSSFVPSKRNKVSKILIDYTDKVLDLIHELLKDVHSDKDIKLQAIKVFCSWIELGFCARLKENEGLIFLLFHLLRSSEYFSDASAALVNFFKLPLKKKYPNSVIKYLEKVTELGPFFDSESHNIEVGQSLANLFTTAAEGNIELILQSLAFDNEESRICLEILNLVLRTVNIKGRFPVEEMCSNVSLNFWSSLHDLALKTNLPLRSEQIVNKYVLDLIMIASNKIKYPNDSDYNNRCEDEIESFSKYRSNFAECVTNLTRMLQSESIDQMITLIRSEILKINDGGQVGWQEFEGIFFIMTSITDSIHLKSMRCVSEIFKTLPQIALDHPILVSQILNFIGTIIEDLDDKMFEESLDFVLNNIHRKEVCSAASTSLNSLVAQNIGRIGFKSEHIVHAIHQALSRQYIDATDCEILVQCMALVMGTLPSNRNVEIIGVIFSPQVNTLLRILSNSLISNEHLKILTQILKMLTSFYYSFNLTRQYDDDARTNFHIQFIEQILACVRQIVINFNGYQTLMSASFQLVSAICRALSSSFEDVGGIMCEIVSTAYNLNPLACVLNSAKHLFKQPFRDPQFDAVLRSTFFSICQKSLEILNHNHHDHPDIVEHFMYFLTATIGKTYEIIQREQNLALMLFNIAMAGMAMNEAGPAISSCQFLSSFISRVKPDQILEVYGQNLLELIIFSIAERFPLDKEHLLANIFMALLENHKSILEKHLSEVLSRDHFPTPIATNVEKMELFQTIMTVGTKKEIKQNIKKVTNLWRGIRDDDESERIVN